jgi:hypothetical protein
VEKSDPPSLFEPGARRDYLIRQITSTEMHYRDMNDGAERVRFRVGK